MTASTTSTTPLPQATPAQQRAFCRLRERYQQDHDLFTQKELARLCFVRWLSAEGATSTKTGDAPASPAAPREHNLVDRHTGGTHGT